MVQNTRPPPRAQANDDPLIFNGFLQFEKIYGYGIYIDQQQIRRLFPFQTEEYKRKLETRLSHRRVINKTIIITEDGVAIIEDAKSPKT